MQVLAMGIDDGIMIGVEYPKRDERGVAGFASANIPVSDRVLRLMGPQLVAESLTRKFKDAGFDGPDVCADITAALRLRLHVTGRPAKADLATRLS